MAYKIDLTDQVAVVTGAKGGIGAAVATILAEAVQTLQYAEAVPRKKQRKYYQESRRLGANAEYCRLT